MDVNFFVGENSTGKTSILKLLELLSSPNFWWRPEFNNTDIELGYFSEIVSKTSGDGKSFEIGVSDEIKDNVNNFVWMKFVEKDSTPVIKEFRFTAEKKSIWCYDMQKSGVTYRIKTFDNNESFVDWINDFAEYSDKEICNKQISLNDPLFFIQSLIEKEVLGKDSNDYYSFSDRIFNKWYWIAPIRAKAKRWYEPYKMSYSTEGDHIPLLLFKILNSTSKKKESYIKSLREFGINSGLFDNVSFKGGKKDEPFSLQIHYGKLSVNLTNVGYGISQVLPLIVDLIHHQKMSFAIQQPEIHLHPKAQAAFGDFVFQNATQNKNRLIIETHSDYMINRFRYHLAGSKSKLKAQVLFFKRDELGSKVYELPINTKGQFDGDFVTSYMNFFLEENLKMLEI